MTELKTWGEARRAVRAGLAKRFRLPAYRLAAAFCFRSDWPRYATLEWVDEVGPAVRTRGAAAAEAVRVLAAEFGVPCRVFAVLAGYRVVPAGLFHDAALAAGG